jgi:hypothetical protein
MGLPVVEQTISDIDMQYLNISTTSSNRGRKSKYNSEEERKAAVKEQRKRYIEKKKQEFNKLPLEEQQKRKDAEKKKRDERKIQKANIECICHLCPPNGFACQICRKQLPPVPVHYLFHPYFLNRAPNQEPLECRAFQESLVPFKK